MTTRLVIVDKHSLHGGLFSKKGVKVVVSEECVDDITDDVIQFPVPGTVMC